MLESTGGAGQALRIHRDRGHIVTGVTNYQVNRQRYEKLESKHLGDIGKIVGLVQFAKRCLGVRDRVANIVRTPASKRLIGSAKRKGALDVLSSPGEALQHLRGDGLCTASCFRRRQRSGIFDHQRAAASGRGGAIQGTWQRNGRQCVLRALCDGFGAVRRPWLAAGQAGDVAGKRPADVPGLRSSGDEPTGNL